MLRHGRRPAGALLSTVLLSVVLLPATSASASLGVQLMPEEFASQGPGNWTIAGRDDTPGAVDTWTVTRSDIDLNGCFPAARNSDYIAITGRTGGGALGGTVTTLALYNALEVTETFTTADLRTCLSRTGHQLPTDRYHFVDALIPYTNPAAVAASDGSYDLFTVDGRGARAPFVRRYMAGHWQGSEFVGGLPQSGPGPLRMPDDSANIYYATQDLVLAVGHLGTDHRYFSEEIGGQIQGRPAAILLPNRTVAVFVQGVNHRLYEAVWLPDGSFRGWVNLGGPGQTPWSGPAAASTGGGRVTVAVNTNLTGLATRSYDPATGWGPWRVLSGKAKGDLGAASPAPGVFDLYVRSFGQTLGIHPLYTRRAVNGVWAPWVNLGGEIGDFGNGGPFAAAARGGRTDVWLTGTDGRSYHRSRTTTWSPWIGVPPNDRP
jgi:hypothetical protein